jgi:hypothetical protein
MIVPDFNMTLPDQLGLGVDFVLEFGSSDLLPYGTVDEDRIVDFHVPFLGNVVAYGRSLYSEMFALKKRFNKLSVPLMFLIVRELYRQLIMAVEQTSSKRITREICSVYSMVYNYSKMIGVAPPAHDWMVKVIRDPFRMVSEFFLDGLTVDELSYIARMRRNHDPRWMCPSTEEFFAVSRREYYRNTLYVEENMIYLLRHKLLLKQDEYFEAGNMYLENILHNAEIKDFHRFVTLVTILRMETRALYDWIASVSEDVRDGLIVAMIFTLRKVLSLPDEGSPHHIAVFMAFRRLIYLDTCVRRGNSFSIGSMLIAMRLVFRGFR